MLSGLSLDENVVRSLPLPLARLARRAANAKTVLEQHHAAYYLWEAGLKLLGAVIVVEYAESQRQDDSLSEFLQCLARPAVGHWWGIVRRLTPFLAETGHEPFTALQGQLLGKTRDDLPHTAGLDAVLRESLDGQTGARTTVRLSELFDRLVRHRNQELGHGAVGQRTAAFYERMGRALFSGMTELWSRVDVLAGHKLIYIADVRRHSTGNWQVERYELMGETARRMEPLELPEDQAARLPHPERVYLQSPASEGQPAILRTLHPLVLYDFENAEVSFLNARRGRRNLEYLCYSTGRVTQYEQQGTDHRELLARVLRSSVSDQSVEQWGEKTDAEEPAAEPRTERQRTLGDFELISRLGQGGMGVVYRAWQRTLGREVAVKCLLRAGDAKSEARFAREIRALGQVEHPNLVRIFTSGSDADQWFYAMELVEGANLGNICQHLSQSAASQISETDWKQAVSVMHREARSREQPLSDDRDHPSGRPLTNPGQEPGADPPILSARSGYYLRQVVELMQQIAEATAALHRSGIIHRDIKPGNIMLTPDGTRAVLMDLGLAHLADESDGRLTRTRQFVGTLRYASPEQLLSAGNLDRRADIYSLGATLWELLTLRPLFGATDQTPTPDLMLKIQASEPERPSHLNPQVPTDLEAVVMKCLAKDREQRYASAQDLSDDLGRWLRGERVLARGKTVYYLVDRWYREHFAHGHVRSAALMVIIGLLWGLSQSLAVFLATMPRMWNTFAHTYDKFPSLIPPLTARELPIPDWIVATGMILSVPIFFLLGPICVRVFKPKSIGADLVVGTITGILAGFVSLLLLGSGFVIALGPAATIEDLWTLAKATKPETAVLERSGDAVDPVLSAYGAQGHQGAVSDLQFSSEGRLLASAGREDGTIRLWNVESGQLVRTFFGTWREDGLTGFVPGKARFVSIGADGAARLWEAESGEFVRVFRAKHSILQALVSDDGSYLAARTGNHGATETIVLWDLETGAQIKAVESADCRLLSARSGAIIVSYPKSISRIDLASAQNVISRTGVGGNGRFTNTKVRCPVAQRAFFADEIDAATGIRSPTFAALSVGTLANGENRPIPLGPIGYDDSSEPELLFTPAGDSFAIRSRDTSGARVWDTTSPPKLISELKAWSEVAAFSQDGSRIAFADEQGRITVWDVKTAQKIQVLRPRQTPGPRLAYAQDGSRIATAGMSLKVWNTKERDLSFTLVGHQGYVHDAAFHPRGGLLASAGSDGTVRLWDVTPPPDSQAKRTDRGNQVLELNAFASPATAVAFSFDGSRIAAVSADGLLKEFDLHTVASDRKDHGNSSRTIPDATERRSIPIHDGCATSVAYSRDGRFLLTAGWDAAVKLLDAHTGQVVRDFKEHQGPVDGAVFSPDGRWIASCGADRTVLVREAHTGKVLERLHLSGRVVEVCFNPDGSRLALASREDSSIRDWQKEDQLPVEFGGLAEVSSVAFSPDGSQLAFTQSDQGLRWMELAPAGKTATLYTDFRLEKWEYKDLAAVSEDQRGASLFAKILVDSSNGAMTGTLIGVLFLPFFCLGMAILQTTVAGTLHRRRSPISEHRALAIRRKFEYVGRYFELLFPATMFWIVLLHQVGAAPSPDAILAKHWTLSLFFVTTIIVIVAAFKQWPWWRRVYLIPAWALCGVASRTVLRLYGEAFSTFTGVTTDLGPPSSIGLMSQLMGFLMGNLLILSPLFFLTVALLLGSRLHVWGVRLVMLGAGLGLALGVFGPADSHETIFLTTTLCVLPCWFSSLSIRAKRAWAITLLFAAAVFLFRQSGPPSFGRKPDPEDFIAPFVAALPASILLFQRFRATRAANKAKPQNG